MVDNDKHRKDINTEDDKVKNRADYNLEQMDFKLVLAFSNIYENLYERGEITEDQLEQVLDLIDSYHRYTAAEFKQEIKNIFAPKK